VGDRRPKLAKTNVYKPSDTRIFDTIDRDLTMGAVVGPGDEFEINATSDVAKDVLDAEVVKTIMESIQNGTAFVCVYGRVDYEDVFEKLRTLYYRFKTIRHVGGHWALQPEAEGNYENK
jgi:hypothetical protein